MVRPALLTLLSEQLFTALPPACTLQERGRGASNLLLTLRVATPLLRQSPAQATSRSRPA